MPDAGCGTLTEKDVGRELLVAGWVHKRRDLGQLIFIEIRDHSGMVQAVFDPSENEEAHAGAEALRNEYVVAVRGEVVRREVPNVDHPTGTIELRARGVRLHNRAEVPFPLDESQPISEEARLRHRYVDLRREPMQRNLRLRHRLARAARAALDGQGFVEVETPMLTRSTPEGARDYLVPSRVHPGEFYALPQSPQLFKQLLMIAGTHRYYQFARCFRDEDLRADRQPEFTQIDIEMAFIRQDTVYELIEPLIANLFRELGVEVPAPFRRMPWAEAMERFGVDRPDLRFGMELVDPGETARGTGFAVFDGALENGGTVRGLTVDGAAA
ncbi:MAG: aspartate--tRNA ligase, partial [Planctomycetota bacterium]|nr:aspartate--tRNA ligase [Planctomycetota bacterium]